MNIPYHTDPGHGWLAVPLALLRQLSIHSDISSFSYFDAHTNIAYLEEDCDASLFMAAAERESLTIELDGEHTHSNDDSFIRSLPSYQYNHYLNWS